MITKIGLYRDPRKEKQWVVRWYGEYDPAIGKQRRYSKSFKLKRDAEAFQSQKAMECKGGQQRDKPEEVTLKDFCKNWLECLRVGPETVKLYQNTVQRLLLYFGENMLLRQITPFLAEKFIASLKLLNSKGELSSSTKHRVLRNCRTMFKKATVWEVISKDPFADVGALKVTTKDWQYLRPVEYKKLLKAAPSFRWRALYALCYTAGLRKGEALSLLWTDLDLKKHRVEVRSRPGTAAIPPFGVKDKEKRTVDIPQETVHILEDLATYYEATETRSPYVLLDKEQCGRVKVKWQRFRQEKRPWHSKYLLNNALTRFKMDVEKADLRPEAGKTLSLHTLRKCACKNWAKVNKDPAITQKLAGHADLATTLKYYDQVTEEDRAETAAAIDKLLKQTDARLTPSGNFGENRG